MTTADALAQIALVVGVLGVAALAIQVLAERLELPSVLVFLVGGIVLGLVWQRAQDVAVPATVETVGTFALILILTDGGLRSGWKALRREIGPIAALGIGGTLATFALMAVAAHEIAGLDWPEALVLGAVLSPTDPAAVFSVLGSGLRRAPRVPRVLEGEAGFNDPIAIALTIQLAAAARHSGGPSIAGVAGEMALEGVVGIAVGVAGAYALGRVLGPDRPTLRLQPTLAVLFGAFGVFGAAALLHGSGYLAVYLFALVVGDHVGMPARDAVEGLFDELASLSEIAMFVLLGIALTEVGLRGALLDGILLGLVSIVIVRPLVSFPTLRAFGFTRAESLFGSLAGLKGAVPILLGSIPFATGIAEGARMFALTGIVVLVSLILQGATLGRAADVLGLDDP